MLVLTRTPGTSIVFSPEGSESMLVTVLSTKGNQVRIGITAPASVFVLRTELIIPSTAGQPTKQVHQ